MNLILGEDSIRLVFSVVENNDEFVRDINMNRMK
jgi:hypothetical protein